jgi:hypothetical protein
MRDNAIARLDGVFPNRMGPTDMVG